MFSLPAGAQQAPATSPAVEQSPSSVQIVVGGRRAATLTAQLFRAESPTPQPAVVMLHGCGGLFGKSGALTARERDWSGRFIAKNYNVLLLDSFTARGVSQVCTIAEKDRPVFPRDRAVDALGAMRWLRSQPFVDKARIAVVGWSHGGSSALWTASEVEKLAPADRPRTIVAFYPGCRVPLERAHFKPAVPVTILMGDADDWTPPEPCRELAARHGIAMTEYPGAVHGFDAPNAPRRTRTGVAFSARGDGRVEIGTDPAARAAAIEAVSKLLSDAFAAPPR